jgi:hypothetical protein
MKIKNKIWQDFKSEILNLADFIGDEWDRFDIPEEVDNFKIYVGDCEVFPIFTNKDDLLRVEYDLSLCETKLRTISVSTFKGETRVGITLKPTFKINKL